MAELQKMLWGAERPIAILGGPGWTERASAAFARFAERFDMPVAGSFRRASAFDGEHDNYAGEIGLSANPKLKARIESADLVLLVGGRMSEAAAQGYTLFDIPAPRQRLIHVHADPLEIGRNYHPTLGVIATSPEFCAALEGVEAAGDDPLVGRDASGAGRLSRLERAGPGQSRPRPDERDHVRAAPARSRRRSSPPAPATSPSGSVVSCDSAGSNSRLGPTSGSMGFGLPAAIGADASFPSGRWSALPATAIFS